ncbi:MAG: 2-oxoacid:acceptor oxidoreductase family protein [Ignavibacteriaceae bacterium]|jgi:2-oxoglutarate ferredoxin oxidoreductase subunit gamma|nr:2-oxoacid:acceptor oxidoreductase family protein [Ignavibacteriaceae bacterium]
MTKEHEIIFAGFGGQGVLSLGRLIAYAGMIEGKEVSWMPSYGPEMRGGTANCIVIVSDSRISSPIITRFDTAILLNQPSVDKFEKAVKPGGLLLYEQSTVIHPPTRTDIEIICIPANEEADKLQAKQVANMVMAGAFLEKRPILKIETIIDALKKALPPRRHNLIPVNEQALARGRELTRVTEQVFHKSLL